MCISKKPGLYKININGFPTAITSEYLDCVDSELIGSQNSGDRGFLEAVEENDITAGGPGDQEPAHGSETTRRHTAGTQVREREE